jgi:hypothetical protein
MNLFIFFVFIFQTLYAQQPFFLNPNDPYFTDFLKLQLVIRPDMSKSNQHRDDVSKSRQRIVSIPFSDLSNPWQNRFDFPQETLSRTITIHSGSPFFKDYFPLGKDTVDTWIACRSMIEHCLYCPEALRSYFLDDWRRDEVGVFFRWSEWDHASCNFSKISFSQVQSAQLMEIYNRSGFYTELPRLNHALFQKVLTHRVGRRPEFSLVSIARSFVSKPTSTITRAIKL